MEEMREELTGVDRARISMKVKTIPDLKPCVIVFRWDQLAVKSADRRHHVLQLYKLSSQLLKSFSNPSPASLSRLLPIKTSTDNQPQKLEIHASILSVAEE